VAKCRSTPLDAEAPKRRAGDGQQETSMPARGIRDDMQRVNPAPRPVAPMPQQAATAPEPRPIQPRFPPQVTVAPRIPAAPSAVAPSAGVIGSQMPVTVGNPNLPTPATPALPGTTGAPTGGVNPAARPNTQPIANIAPMRV